MAQSLSKILLHVVFSTKDRAPAIPTSVGEKLHAYLASACRAQGSQAYRVGGTVDHVHVACTLPRTMTVSQLVEAIKVSSSKWIKDSDNRCRTFAWQSGYAAFSLGQSQLDALIRYIDSQEERHRTKAFKEELIEFLNRYDVEFDERYIWT